MRSAWRVKRREWGNKSLLIDALDGRSGEREGKGIGKVRERIVWELEENVMGRAGLA